VTDTVFDHDAARDVIPDGTVRPDFMGAEGVFPDLHLMTTSLTGHL
jgi:hypothetical protein